MNEDVLARLWDRTVSVHGTVARRTGGMIWLSIEGQPFARAFARAVPAWDPPVGERVELGGFVLSSTEHSDRRPNFHPIFVRVDGQAISLNTDDALREMFPEEFPPRDVAPPMPPPWLEALDRHGVVAVETVDPAWFVFDPAGIVIHAYDREAHFARGVLCYGKWMRDTEDPIADLARIAEAPAGMFRTISIDPVEEEQARFEVTIDGMKTEHVVELTIDLGNVVAKMNTCLARARLPRRIHAWSSELFASASLYIAREPREIEALCADLPGARIFAP